MAILAVARGETFARGVTSATTPGSNSCRYFMRVSGNNAHYRTGNFQGCAPRTYFRVRT